MHSNPRESTVACFGRVIRQIQREEAKAHCASKWVENILRYWQSTKTTKSLTKGITHNAVVRQQLQQREHERLITITSWAMEHSGDEYTLLRSKREKRERWWQFTTLSRSANTTRDGPIQNLLLFPREGMGQWKQWYQRLLLTTCMHSKSRHIHFETFLSRKGSHFCKGFRLAKNPVFLLRERNNPRFDQRIQFENHAFYEGICMILVVGRRISEHDGMPRIWIESMAMNDGRHAWLFHHLNGRIPFQRSK